MSDSNRNYILFDDNHRDHLLPFTFIRPVAEIRIGILTIREKWEKYTGNKFTWLTQEYLRDKYPLQAGEDNILINGAVTPNASLLEEINALQKGEVLMSEYIFIAGYVDKQAVEEFDGLPPAESKQKQVHSSFNYISKLWHLYRMNGEELLADFELLTANRKSALLSKTNNLIRPENIFVEEGANVEYATINANPGPVYIGKNSLIMEGSLIRGPFALCEGARLKMGTRIYGPTTIGPFSKAGGEITNSVMMAYSNKVHEGYLGNSVLGEWCNIGAGSNTSNLKNNYTLTKVWNYATAKFEDTDLQFCGLLMGDYSRCGINTMFNTATVVGISSNIYGSGFPGSFIPSFSWGGAPGFETYRIAKAIETIEMGMALHELTLSDIDKQIIDRVFMLTGRFRKTV
jgi:UDP-N-acetylglucosamine diphosphorylase/glucosamine-1-phosphate N-acetyltransferase